MFFGGWGCCDPEQFETIQFAHTSVKNCDAIAVMSAHEPNDVAWATTGPKNPRESFRPLNDQNLNNSQSTQFLRFAGSPADMLLIEPTALDWDVALQEYADDA